MKWKYRFYSKKLSKRMDYTDVTELLVNETLDGPHDSSTYFTVTKLGKDGWELISVCPINDDGGETVELLMTFRMPSA